jgi:hypothetical protein
MAIERGHATLLRRAPLAASVTQPEPASKTVLARPGVYRQLSVFATPIGQLIPFGPWLPYPYGFFASDKYCWW